MDQRIKERLKDMFAVPRSEARAWVFVLTVITAAAAWVVYEQAFAGRDTGRFNQEHKVLQAWLGEKQKADSASSTPQDLFDFDPNGLPLEQWRKLGLSEKQAMAIHRYEERGGNFRSKADLSRMRVVRPELFAKWEPHILLPDSGPAVKPGSSRSWSELEQWPKDTLPARVERSSGSRTRIVVEVNTCDSSQLVALPGIGPSFARGIIKYREQLGGYVSLDQLAEVFVLKDKPDAVERIKELLVIDTLMVNRIPINTCTAEQLAAHPYVRWKLAKPLAAYRDQHGPFKSVGAIKGCAVITDEVYHRIAPYLTVE